MPSIELTESKSSLLPLTPAQARDLSQLGKQLAGSQSFWGARPAIEGPDHQGDRSVISCVSDGSGTFKVTVHNAVGIIAVDGLQLVVHPKIPVSHLHYLMSWAIPAPRSSSTPTTSATDTLLWDLIASWFLSSVESLLRHGLLSGYQNRSGLLKTVRGSINVHDTAQLQYRGTMLVSCQYDDFSPDTPVNRILKAALLALTHGQWLRRDLRKRALRGSMRFEDVGPLRADDLRSTLDRHLARYDTALAWARHVLAATGRSLAAGSAPAHTFLIRTPDLVESAVRALLAMRLADQAKITKKGIQLAGSTLRLNPDLVIGNAAVGDVKYKLSGKDWSRPDLYQTVAFATGYRVRQACVITFSDTLGAKLPPAQVGDVLVQMFRWDCAPGTDPAAAAEKLTQEVGDWITASLAALTGWLP